MIDTCGRNIDYIRISLTDRCNLRCVYCMPEEGMPFLPHDMIMSYEEILRLCRVFASLGIHKVKLTGGEPLVRKNAAFLIEELKKIDGIDNVTMTTNGILLKEQMKQLAKAGLDAVNISLDTLSGEQFEKLTRFNELENVMHGIEEALRYPEISVKINCVPIRGKNMENTVVQMVGMAEKQNIHVRFIELMPIGIGKELDGYNEDSLKEIIEKEYGKLVPYQKTLGNGPCVYYSLDGFKGKVGFISAVSHKFCNKCNRIRLTSDGYLKNCLQYSDGINLKEKMNSGITDEELKKVIYETILQKPKGHEFDKAEKNNGLEERRMSQIGG